MFFHKVFISLGAAALSLTMATSAMAIPKLQLFIEGADYETAAENPDDPESWAKLGTSSFRLWVLADTSKTYRIRNVNFVASFASGLTPTIAFTPSTTLGAGGFTDPSTPVAPVALGPVSLDDLVPPPGDSPLTAHSPLGDAGRIAVQWDLGMFKRTDSPLGDTQPTIPVEAADNWFPSIAGGETGQINVYDVLVSGLPIGAQVHFDVYGIAQERSCTSYNSNGSCLSYSSWTDVTPNQYVNAPFSHDARWEQIAAVPTPGTAALLLGGLGGLGWISRRRKPARA